MQGTIRVNEKVCWALMGTEFQLLNRPMRCEPKDPEENVTLDRPRREAGLVGAAKRQRGVEEVGGAQTTGQGHRVRWQHRLVGWVGQQAYHC